MVQVELHLARGTARRRFHEAFPHNVHDFGLQTHRAAADVRPWLCVLRLPLAKDCMEDAPIARSRQGRPSYRCSQQIPPHRPRTRYGQISHGCPIARKQATLTMHTNNMRAMSTPGAHQQRQATWVAASAIGLRQPTCPEAWRLARCEEGQHERWRGRCAHRPSFPRCVSASYIAWVH